MAATVHSKYVGGALLYYQTHRHRIVGAVGGNARFFRLHHPDVGASTVDPPGWTSTVVEAGSGTTEWVASDTEYGASTITCAANENDGGSYQLDGSQFGLLDSGNWLYFRLKAQINDVDQTDFFAGLAITDTAILGGVADRIGFQSIDGDAGIDFLVEKNSTETKTEDLLASTDATDFDLEFVWDGATSNLYEYVNGAAASTATATTNLPDDVLMRLSLEFLTGEAVANVMTVKELVVCSVDLS